QLLALDVCLCDAFA
ncbi:DUF645 family protein, partial [Vibrio mimicus]